MFQVAIFMPSNLNGCRAGAFLNGGDYAASTDAVKPAETAQHPGQSARLHNLRVAPAAVNISASRALNRSG